MTLRPATVLAPLGGLLVLTMLALGGCERAPQGPFRPEALASGGEAIHLNEDVEICFSEPLAAGLQPRRAVRVTDAAGRALAFGLEARGHWLVVSPDDPAGWPLTPWIDIALPWPSLGRGIRSAREAEMTESFGVRVPLLQSRRRFEGSLALLEDNIGGPDARSGARWDPDPRWGLELHFNAPLDPASLRAGIQVVDATRGELVDVEAFLDPTDGHTVRLRGLVDGVSAFQADTSYQVELTRHLRSLDGRTLLAESTRPFTTRPGASGVILARFERPEDVAPESRADLLATGGDGILRPTPRDELYGTDGGQAKTWSQDIFPASPSVVQVLIPAEALPLHACLLKQIHFRAHGRPPPGARVDDLTVTLGYLDPGTALDVDMEENASRARGTRTLQLELRGDSWMLAGGHEDEQDIELGLVEPFFPYPGHGESLLLTLTLPEGVAHGFREPVPVEGTALSEGRDGWPVVVRSLGDRYGRPVRFQPLIYLITLTWNPVTTRWYEIPAAIRNPVLSPSIDVRGRGMQYEDFLVQYQAGRRIGSVIEPVGDWLETPPRLGSASSVDRDVRAVRMRVQFLPRPHVGGEEPPEIESILLRYQDRQAGPVNGSGK